MKIFKYLVFLVISVCCYDNTSNTMEKQTSISKYTNSEISWNDFEEIILSFPHNETLNNNQKEFIKQLVKNIPNLEQYTGGKYYNINDLCNPNPNIGNHDEFPFSYKEILNYITVDVFDSFYKRFQDQQGIYNIEENYNIFLDKIKDCYQQNIISKEQYINLLKYLLFCNTSRIFFELNNKMLNNNSQYFIDIVFRYLAFDYYPNNNIANSVNMNNITEFINTYIEQNTLLSIRNEIKSIYKTYKSIASKIISELLQSNISSEYDTNNKITLLRKNILIPIVLGIFNNIVYTFNKEMNFGSWNYYLDKLLEKSTIDKITSEFSIIENK